MEKKKETGNQLVEIETDRNGGVIRSLVVLTAKKKRSFLMCPSDCYPLIGNILQSMNYALIHNQ